MGCSRVPAPPASMIPLEKQLVDAMILPSCNRQSKPLPAIRAGADALDPLRIIPIPLNCQADARFEIELGLPVQFLANFCRH